MAVRKDYLEYATDFVNSVARKDIGLRYAKIFGSYVKNIAHQDSDIDILLVADKFVGAGFIDNFLIADELVKYDMIQARTYGLDDFREGDPFIDEINKHCIDIKIN